MRTVSLLLLHCLLYASAQDQDGLLEEWMGRQDQEDLLEGCKDVEGNLHKLGDSYIGVDGCNTCQCTQGGISSCTKKMCTEMDTRLAEAGQCVDNRGVLHKEGESYTHVDGCNNCQCTKNGGACTKRFCLASATCEGGTKKSGDSWIHKDGCNKCQCSIFGTLCTEKACSGLVKPNSDTDSMNNVDGDAIVLETGDTPCTDSEGNKRMPGEDWLTPDSCNICQCLGDNAEPSCTKMGCRVRLERLRQSSGGSLGSTASSLLPSLAIFVSFIIALL